MRMTFMMLVLLKRHIPLEESLSVPLAFGIYYVGFPLLAANRPSPLDLLDVLGIALFVVGSVINSGAELQRHFWKAHPENAGKLYTGGLFRYAIHINYFGDVLWVTGYALVTHNLWSALIPAFLFVMFAAANIPKLDAYLRTKYGEAFVAYEGRTKRFIPGVY